MNNKTQRIHHFRFEINATIVLSHLTRMNEQQSYNGFILFISRWMRLSFYHDPRESMKNEASSDIGFILFVTRYTKSTFFHYSHEWMKNEYANENGFILFLRFEHRNPSITTKRNEWRTKHECKMFHSFRSEMIATILLSLLIWMNEERICKPKRFVPFFPRCTRLSFYHYLRQWMKNGETSNNVFILFVSR
jgi:hypothetical protein